MKIVGLTGGIGSGKTIVSKVFGCLGIPVYNSDTEAKLLINSDIRIVTELKTKFGADIYNNNGLNRKKLSEYIFNNKENLNFVNEIVHPAVKQHFNKWTEGQNSDYLIKEAAILFESGTYKDVDHIITVSAPEEIRIARILKSGRLNQNEIKARMQNQISDEEKIRQSDFVIFNDNIQLTLPQIFKIHKTIKNY